MSTMRDVAALAGVAAKTVSRVINCDRYVSADVRQRVEQAIAELKYVPNMLAQSFRTGRDRVIGVAVPNIADPFFGQVIQAVEQIARSRGMAVLVTSLGENSTDEQAAVEALLRRQITGLIIAPTSTHHGYLGAWQSGTELVFIDRPPHRLTADSVIEDDFGGATSAVRHLIGRGHRRIAFLGNSNAVTTDRRLKGYRSALAEARIAPQPELEHIYPEIDGRNAVQGLHALRALSEPPTAIFSSNSQSSVAIIPELHTTAAGMALISFGDFPMANALTPSVTVLDQRPADLGRTAAQRLFDRVEHPGRRYKRQQILPVELLIRESSEIRGPAPRLHTS